jgi:putative hydrolase of the HAD superfamily
MQLEINTNSFFVFDLDDTLFQEIDFLKSAYRHIARTLEPRISCNLYEEMFSRYRNKENVFLWIISQYGRFMRDIDVNWLLREYREHLPEVQLRADADAFLQLLQQLSIPMGLITDGRSITQRNKLKALGIEAYFQDIIISEEFGSEKPDPRNYEYFEQKYPGKRFVYIGDNPAKDFIVPLQLGWTTVCLENSGHNIHDQDFTRYPNPHYIVTSLQELELVQPAAMEAVC